jgi:hypothetical protein
MLPLFTIGKRMGSFELYHIKAATLTIGKKMLEDKV